MKAPTWDELEKAVNDEDTFQFLLNTPEQYRKAMALALALARWSPKRKDGVRGTGGNGLCAYDAMLSGERLSSSCPHCPLAKAGEWCHREGSIFLRWSELRSKPSTPCFWAQRNEVADEMYNLLCELYKKEYDRC